jgi:hypothetical protein
MHVRIDVAHEHRPRRAGRSAIEKERSIFATTDFCFTARAQATRNPSSPGGCFIKNNR